MGSKIVLKNAQDQEFSINHLDNAGAIAINSNDISTKSQIETTIAPYNKGFKNYIINGNFDIWQYGLSQTTSSYGSDDRWVNANAGSTKTHSQIACTDIERALFNASYFSRTIVTSVAGANNYVRKEQAIENVTKLAGKTVTLSFWAKADSAKNIAIEFSQAFGTGGTPSAVITNIGAGLIALTNTWQKKTITVTIPSIVGKTLGTDGVHTTATWLRIWFDAGSSFNAVSSSSLGQQSGTFDIAQVQLEEGSVATPFEQRPVGLELSLCQRYYEKLVVNLYANTATPARSVAVARAYWAVSKRVNPSVAWTPAYFANIFSFIMNDIGVDGCRGVMVNDYAGAAEFNATITASAEL